MKVLVTGGAGFIGSCLAEKLLENDYDVICYDLKSSKHGESVIGDITDSKKVFKVVGGCDYVFHLAAVANLDFARVHPNIAIKTNIQGTYTVAKCCSQLKVPLSFASTACVYGNTPNHPSREESICVPTDIYGSTKLVGENILKGFHKNDGLNCNILRFGTTYGPDMREALAVHMFISQALNGQLLTVHGSGLQTRCFIYVDDLIDGIVQVLERGISGETLNLATDEEVSVLQMADMILEMTGRPKGNIKFVEDRPGQIMKEQLCIRKAVELLNWTPKIGFNEGVRRTVKWLKTLR